MGGNRGIGEYIPLEAMPPLLPFPDRNAQSIEKRLFFFGEWVTMAHGSTFGSSEPENWKGKNWNLFFSIGTATSIDYFEVHF